MGTLAQIVGANLVSGVLSVWIASLVLWLKPRSDGPFVDGLVNFALGTLLGAVWLAMLPEALEQVGPGRAATVLGAVLAGIVGFFLIERLVYWQHCHHHGKEVGDEDRQHIGAPLILVSDGLHNLADGVLLAAAFMTDTRVGIGATVAVLAHEIPQEIGDFAILLKSGYRPLTALFFNSLSGLMAVLGGIGGWLSLNALPSAAPVVMAIAAGGFTYVALADLVPSLHRRWQLKPLARQLALIGLGIATVASSSRL